MPKSTLKKIKIMVVDDHPLVRQGLAQVINQEDDLVMDSEAGDPNEAVQVFNKSRPDLAIVDISLRGGNGLDLIKTLLVDNPKLPVLVLSMHDESLYVERVFHAGARGYLMKQEATEKVVSAVRKILSGDVYVSDRMNDLLLSKFVLGKGKPSKNASVENLSNRELEIIQLMGQGRGTRQIAEELHVSVKTVESHYAKMKEKLKLTGINELIQYAVKWYHTDN